MDDYATLSQLALINSGYGDRLLISFSGGKTSAYMTYMIINKASQNWKETIVVFANTGQENEQTLEFVDKCDRFFGFKTVWVEAKVNQEKGKGTIHKVVSFDTASRLGEPFESVISKYGIPNTSYPHCTRELKLAPIESYARSLGWGNSYTTAIGIRLDETRRVRKDAASCSIVYPLVDWFPSDKSDVNDFWERQKFSLMLEEHEGNCKWCWKKSFSKHARLLKEKEEIYDFPSRMEIEYGHIQSNQEKERGQDNRVFFRGNRSTSDLKRYCSALEHQKRITDPDENAGCGESCELYSTIQLDF